MATPPSFADGDGDDMNASVWGELQNFIDLSIIYAKLPLAPFFRLRQVCKEWNRLASDRQFLEQNFRPPISSNTYFVVTRPSGRHVLLTLEGSSWSSTPVPRARCEVSGLLFEDSDRNRVFDLHTRVFHTLPPLPVVVQAPPSAMDTHHEDPMILMIVDTTLIPYGFRVIIADEVIGTRIYDSNNGAWTHKPSTHPYSQPPFSTTCVHYKKSLYIRTGDESSGWGFDVQIYDLERDEWGYQEIGSAQDVWEYSEIGVWQDRLFMLSVDTRKFPYDVVLEEILTTFEETKSWFDIIPKDLCQWLLRGSMDHKIMNKFCGEHVLLYNRAGGEERAVLYNLNRKSWDKIELLAAPMSLERAHLRNDH